jgi:hypothetical protein
MSCPDLIRLIAGVLQLVGVGFVGVDFYSRRRAALGHRTSAAVLAGERDPLHLLDGAQTADIRALNETLEQLQLRLAADDVVAGWWALGGAVLVAVGIVLTTMAALL